MLWPLQVIVVHTSEDDPTIATTRMPVPPSAKLGGAGTEDLVVLVLCEGQSHSVNPTSLNTVNVVA